MIYGSNMDKQCISLCNALNSIPGIKTRESCCGHGKHGFQIWLSLSDRRKVKYLSILGRIFDKRYGGIEGWSCEISNDDIPEHIPLFRIISKSKGYNAYNESEKIAKNIHQHLEHAAFRRIFYDRIDKLAE